MQFQSIIFMASPQNIVTATHKKYDVHPGSLLPITAHIVVTSNGLLYYYILSLVTDFLEELLLRFPSCQTQTFVLSWKKLPSSVLKMRKQCNEQGMKRLKRQYFHYFLHTVVVYDTSESLDTATFEKVLEKVVFLKSNGLF